MENDAEQKLSSDLQREFEKMTLSHSQKKTLESILAKPVFYVPDDRFYRRKIMATIMNREISVFPGESLRTEDETVLFAQMNYMQYLISLSRQRLLNQGSWKKQEILNLFQWYHRWLEFRSKLVTVNMGLVFYMMQKVKYSDVEYMYLISEGNLALLQAVEKYNYLRGYKFSTYACQAIVRGFFRAVKRSYRYRSLFPRHLDPTMEKDDYIEKKREEIRQDLADEIQMIMKQNLANLSDVEKSVVQYRFPLEHKDEKPLTLKQVGDKIGFSKEGIRQIQNRALSRIREVAKERIAMI